MFLFKRKHCTHENLLWIRKKNCLIRKCVKCGHKIRYGNGVQLIG